MKYLNNNFVIYGFTFFTLLLLGLFFSKGSIPNQEGYFELGWHTSHIDFNRIFTDPAITPLNFLVAILIERSLHISVATAWKLMDLTFSSFLGVLLVNLYLKLHKTKHFFEKILPGIVIITSVGYFYSFTSMSGEGMPLFFAAAGLYYWNKKSFILATLLFILSFFSKFTIYLIAPGIFIWTFINIRNFSRKNLIQLFIMGVIFTSIFISYHSFKNWSDIKLQSSYINNFSPWILLNNFPPYFLALLLGAPIVIIFAFLNPSWKNLYFISGISAGIMLLRRYFYWNHPQQIIVFLMLYFFTSPKAKVFLKNKYIFLQLIFSICLLALLPIKTSNFELFHKHYTIKESIQIDTEVMKDLNGQKVGYFMNRRFDEPFFTYEISYLNPVWDFIINDTKYIVLPSINIPKQLTDFKHCSYTFNKQIGSQSIFKVNCNLNK